MRRLLLTLLTVVLGILAIAQPAGAHSGKQSYLYLSLYDGAVEGRVEIPVVDLGPLLGVEIPQGAAGGPIVEDRLDAIHDYLDANVALRSGDTAWPLAFSGWSLLETGRGTYAQFPFVVDAELSDAPRDFTATFSAVIEADPEKDALLLIENDFGTAVFDNEGDHLVGFSVGNTEQRVVLVDESVLTSMRAVAAVGVDQIRAGIDTMLVGVAVTAMVVVGSARRAVRGLALFLVAQAATLWAVGLTASPSVRLVALLGAVAALAAGIACIGAAARPWSDAVVVAVAGGLGAVQGVVLGGRFSLRRLDATEPIASALGHHAGVLLATGLVVAFTALPLMILRSTRWLAPVVVVLGAVVTVYGLAWTGEWIADADWPIERAANPWRVWPRNLLLVAAVVVAAVAVRWRSHQPDRPEVAS